MTNATTDQESLEWMLADILNRESLLTSWELDFINDITVHIEARFGLTEKQDACFTKIWERVTEQRPHA